MPRARSVPQGRFFIRRAGGLPYAGAAAEVPSAFRVMNAVIRLSSTPTREYWEIAVVYEDEHLLALNKPSGLLSSPDRYEPSRPNLIRLLHSAISEGKPWARERGLTYLMNVHRLEFDTSGILLLAKSKPVFTTLANRFGSEKPGQSYVALVQGEPSEERFEVNARLKADADAVGLMRVDPRHGKPSRTVFAVRERFRDWTVLQCEPFTSRPNQIRAHLRHAGLPLAGDTMYGGQPLWLSRLKPDYHLKPRHTERPLVSRAALHAEEVGLLHPVTGVALTITAPWPKDLKVAVKYLRKYASRPAG